MSSAALSEQEALLERLRIEAQLHEYWHDVDRRWLCAHRNFDVLFAGGTKPTNLKIDKPV